MVLMDVLEQKDNGVEGAQAAVCYAIERSYQDVQNENGLPVVGSQKAWDLHRTGIPSLLGPGQVSQPINETINESSIRGLL